MRKMLVMLTLLLFTSGVLLAQKTISGKVTDEKGDPIANASVVVKGSTVGTTTNDAGSFTLSLPANAKTLVISSVAFSTLEVSIGTKSDYSVSLKSNLLEGEEVVVTGYSRIRKGNFAGAATVLNAVDVTANRPVGSFNHVLQGRVPGMLVNSGSGQPGNNAQVTIRGVQSIQGAGVQPLYVIDGIPTSDGDFQTLNPNDFETITVLKDANAAALYGARGGTGVIVITTKQGKSGAVQINAKAQLGITLAPNFDRLNLMSTSEALAYQESIAKVTNVANANFQVPGWYWSRNNPAKC